MLFENLNVSRIVMHEIFQRNTDKTIRPPAFSNELEILSPEAMGAFRLRMTDALSAQSQSIQMRIIKHGADSFLRMAESIINKSDEEFISGSKMIANKLVDSQSSRRIPSGVLIVFEGTVGTSEIPFIGAIKAETQAGFRRAQSGEKVVVEFLKNIFLTPAARLYKIGLMLFDDTTKPTPEGRRAFVFDSNISISHREAAATYFYETFLGCALPNDGAYETVRFFDLTKDFVRKSDMETEKKRTILDSLYVFVRDEQEPTFTADQFGSRYLPAELQDDYANFLESKKFTSNAVVRDISQMGNRLRRRRLKFGGDIELLASPEALADKVEITSIPAEDNENKDEKWTRIIIHNQLTGEQ